ncbi:MAG: hypothetical protein U5L09_10625 [Bacteroidales bacterium]|nr:hypothetical protein [Bacteroidales bacterium]
MSSYWLYFMTSTSYNLAVNLVSSMKVDVICQNEELEKLLNVKPISYKAAIAKAFERIEQKHSDIELERCFYRQPQLQKNQ